MKRRACSDDIFSVPGPSFVLKDAVGSIYFCNLRCFYCNRGARSRRNMRYMKPFSDFSFPRAAEIYDACLELFDGDRDAA
jgi:hypothetical protein